MKTERLDWLADNPFYTRRFAFYVGQRCRDSSVKAVAEELHFGRAAERLLIAQSVVSQQIRRLEQGLGLQLVERTTRHVAMTDAGELLVARARRVLVEVEGAHAEMQRLGGVTVIGPVIDGLLKPMQIVQMGATVSDLVNHAALAAYGALNGER